MSSWKTTTFGILAAVQVVITEVKFLFDTDMTTNPDWNVVIAVLLTAGGLFTARDNDKSSEDVQAR